MTAAVFVSPLVCKSKKKKERLECKRRTQRVDRNWLLLSFWDRSKDVWKQQCDENDSFGKEKRPCQKYLCWLFNIFVGLCFR